MEVCMTREELAADILKIFVADLKWRPEVDIKLDGEEEPRKASEILCEDAIAYADKLFELLG